MCSSKIYIWSFNHSKKKYLHIQFLQNKRSNTQAKTVFDGKESIKDTFPRSGCMLPSVEQAGLHPAAAGGAAAGSKDPPGT